MALYFKEYLNAKVHTENRFNDNIHLSEQLNSNPAIGKKGAVIAEIEGLHNVKTRNFTLYTEEAMKHSIGSWTYPYEKALLKHHDEDDGEVIGRVKQASVKNSEVLKGSKALFLTVEVLEKENKEATLDGRNKTVSVGAIGTDVTCSICGQQLANGDMCGHERGNIYDGSVCYWIVNKMEAKELSFVNIPSDNYAQVTRVYKVADKGGVKNIMSKEPTNLKESTQNLAEGEEKNKDNLDLKPETKEKEEKNTTEDIVLESKKKLIQELNKDKEELKETIKKKDQTILETQKELAKLKEDISKVQETILLKDEMINKEIAMREALEEELSQNKNIIKESLIKKISQLREKHLGLETDTKTFSERSIDSLKDTIIDLKEQAENSIHKHAGTVLKEGLVDDNKDKELKEKAKKTKAKKEEENNTKVLNLAEAMNDIFK